MTEYPNVEPTENGVQVQLGPGVTGGPLCIQDLTDAEARDFANEILRHCGAIVEQEDG